MNHIVKLKDTSGEKTRTLVKLGSLKSHKGINDDIRYLIGTLGDIRHIAEKLNDGVEVWVMQTIHVCDESCERIPEIPVCRKDDFVLYAAPETEEINNAQPIKEVASYDPRFCTKVAVMMQDGCEIPDIIYYLGIDFPTFFSWCEKYPEFKKAIQEGEWLLHGPLI